MLDNKAFDLWADGYDRSVDISDEDNTYPFAGYKKVLAGIYKVIRKGHGNRVLDIGFGTGILTTKLYENGYDITGIDFSERMIQIAKDKMPSARLIQHDFSKGLPAELRNSRFDAIVCTYAIHHLDDEAKIAFLKDLQTHLNPAGRIFIGDVAFATREELRACRESCGDEWDDDEFYIVAEDIEKEIHEVQFEKISYCAGILMMSDNAMLLKTERLTIRHIDADDWKSIRDIWVDFSSSEYAQYDKLHNTDDADVQQRIAKWAAANSGTEHMFFAICLDEILIGYIAFNIRENGHEIGYCFHSAYHGKGYAKESHLALFDYMRTLGITKFSAGTALNNTPSVKLLTSLGFKLVGQEKVSFYKDAMGNDIVFDGGIFEYGY